MSQKLNDYEIVKELGKGTYANIYLVTKTSSDIKNYYVIKQINLEGLSVEVKQSFKNEATILSKIKSEFVVKFIESFEENNFFNIVMEYCEGGDLEKFLLDRKKIPLNDNFIWKLFIQIVIGLGEIHNMNILHRDLKTPNIFLTKDNDIKIGDLGIAKQLYRIHFTKTVIGTPYYLSPEICKEKSYNEKSDIWALGCVLYELCTFVHPFEATNQASLIKKILEQNPKPIPATYDNNFNRIVKQLLQKEMNKRPSCKLILKEPYVMKKAKELKLYNKYQKLIGYNINKHISNEINNAKNSMKKNLTLDVDDKKLNIKKRPISHKKIKNDFFNISEKNKFNKFEKILKINNPFSCEKRNSKKKKIAKPPSALNNMFRSKNNIKNKINIRVERKKSIQKHPEINLTDTLGMNLKSFKKNHFVKTEEEIKINEDKKPILKEKLSKENNKRIGNYRDIFMSKNNSLKFSPKESVQESLNLNQMITDFQPDSQKQKDFIYNSPKILDSEDKNIKNEKNSGIRSSAFHIYYNEENKINEVENNYLSESESDKENSNNKKNSEMKEYEGNNNENDIENEHVKAFYNPNNNDYFSNKKIGNGENNNLIKKKEKELLDLIGTQDFQNIMQIFLFNVNSIENENSEKINEIIQNYEPIKKERFHKIYSELISLKTDKKVK